MVGVVAVLALIVLTISCGKWFSWLVLGSIGSLLIATTNFTSKTVRLISRLKRFLNSSRTDDLSKIMDPGGSNKIWRARLKDNLRRWLAGDLAAIPYDSLIDHSPVHYAVHLSNHLADAR